jgi:hypothetical protein
MQTARPAFFSCLRISESAAVSGRYSTSPRGATEQLAGIAGLTDFSRCSAEKVCCRSKENLMRQPCGATLTMPEISIYF